MGSQKTMQGKRVLVTGSGTGIGRGIALEFAEQGADIAFHYSHSGAGAAAAVEQARKLGVKAEAFQADFTVLDDVVDLARKAIDFLGNVEILVNNAGITMNLPFGKVTPEQFDQLYRVNVRGMFFLTQACIASMLENGGGVVVNITSIHALSGMQEHSVYAGTKGAILSFTRQLAIELAPKNIRVNAIAPGSVVVENYAKAIESYDVAAHGRAIPAGFVGQPKDIARVAVFLASEDARFILGQTLIVDGGTTSMMSFNEDFRKPLTGIAFGKGYVPVV